MAVALLDQASHDKQPQPVHDQVCQTRVQEHRREESPVLAAYNERTEHGAEVDEHLGIAGIATGAGCQPDHGVGRQQHPRDPRRIPTHGGAARGAARALGAGFGVFLVDGHVVHELREYNGRTSGTNSPVSWLGQVMEGRNCVNFISVLERRAPIGGYLRAKRVQPIGMPHPAQLSVRVADGL